ncbi:MAG: hypothetical protein HYS13_13850 [Planctomycetia bacterium]|nr:hypothetical protein [Planctomycetia bacterium]
MLAIDGWDIALLSIAGLAAVVALARLMSHRRAESIGRFRRELPHEPPPTTTPEEDKTKK